VTPAASVADPWAEVVGQQAVVAQLQAAAVAPVHAYLLVGPRGSGKRTLARSFAAALLSAGLEGEDAERAVRLALAGRHPDLREFERTGPYITVEQAAAITTESLRSPVEGGRKVLVLVDFHLVQPAVEGKLLKSIEEPPPPVVFVVLAESVPPLLVPIASRCVRLDVESVPEATVAEALQASGVAGDLAVDVAAATGGDLVRARLLATDPRFSLRQAAWRSVPSQLDGRGSTVFRLVAELRAMIDDAATPLEATQAEEVAELEARVEQYGERGSGRRDQSERHKRELRRLRTDELRLGFATLASRYRDAVAAGSSPRVLVEAMDALQEANEALLRNPNEALLLQALFLRLPWLSDRAV
jgi:DNA polymerase III subunit delta'